MGKYYYQAVSMIEVEAPSQYSADQAIHKRFQKNHIPHVHQFHLMVKGTERGDEQKYRVDLEIGSPTILRRNPP